MAVAAALEGIRDQLEFGRFEVCLLQEYLFAHHHLRLRLAIGGQFAISVRERIYLRKLLFGVADKH